MTRFDRWLRSGDTEPDLSSTAVDVASAGLAAVLFGDVSDDGEAEPRTRLRPCVIGTVESIEDPVHVGRVDATPVIAYHEPAVRQLDVDGLVDRTELVGVAQQIGDRPIEQRCVPST